MLLYFSCCYIFKFKNKDVLSNHLSKIEVGEGEEGDKRGLEVIPFRRRKTTSNNHTQTPEQ